MSAVIAKTILKKFVAPVLSIIAIIWIAYILFDERIEIVLLFKNFTCKSIMWLGLTVVLGAVAVFQYVLIFKEIITRQSGLKLSLTYLSFIFFKSQIIRYLPGRFFGIVYQSIMTKDHFPVIVVVKSNIEFMIFFILFHFLTSIVLILMCSYSQLIGLVSFFSLIGMIYLYLSLDLFYVFTKLLQFLIPAKWDKFKLSMSAKIKYSNKSILTILFAYFTSWFFYLLAWVGFVKIFPDLNIKTSILACATYTFSWVVGFLSMLTPGGVGIREAVFIYVSTFFDLAGNVAFLAVFLRIWLVLIDILLVVFSFSLNIFRKKSVNVG